MSLVIKLEGVNCISNLISCLLHCSFQTQIKSFNLIQINKNALFKYLFTRFLYYNICLAILKSNFKNYPILYFFI
jgi:hypothetical protein